MHPYCVIFERFVSDSFGTGEIILRHKVGRWTRVVSEYLFIWKEDLVVLLKVLLSRWFGEAEEYHKILESGKAMT